MRNAPGRLSRACQRFVVATSGGPLGRAWMAAYRSLVMIVAQAVTRSEPGSAVYARSGTAGPDVVPGISDIDVAVVLPPTSPPGASRDRVHRRFAAVGRWLPGVGRLVEIPCVYEEPELAALAEASYATFGLSSRSRGRAAYGPDAGLLDRRRILERPGLYEGVPDWALLAGPDRRPRAGRRDAGSRLVAAWLELAFWWRFAFAACLDPTPPHTALLSVKLVAEPARIWLWLAHGERCATRREALERIRTALPEEAETIELALRLSRALHRLPEPPLGEVFRALARFSTRIAELVGDRAFSKGTDSVELLGSVDANLVAARSLTDDDAPPRVHPSGALPLCDWRALAVPTHADESFTRVEGAASDPSDVGRAARATGRGAYRVLVLPGALLFPIPELERPLPRNIACAGSDPVSFALLSGHATAAFPRLAGWSVADVANRAVAEQRARLQRYEREGASLAEVSVLLCAARAALLHDSLGQRPTLPVTLAATAAALGDRDERSRSVADEAIGVLRTGTLPTQAAVHALRDCVLRLPGYAG